METFTKTDAGFAEHIGKIVDFQYAIVDHVVKKTLEELSWSDELTLWLGHSKDYTVWTLSVIPWDQDSDKTHNRLSYCHAVLKDPPMRRDHSIIRVLLLASEISVRTSRLPVGELRKRIENAEFPEYKTAGSYLPCLPEWLHDIPAKIELGVRTSMGSFAPTSFLLEHEVDSFADAMEVLARPRWEGILFSYALKAQGIVPFLGWDYDCTLVRQNRMCGAEQREATVQGALPWAKEPQREIMRVYQNVRQVSYGFGFDGPDYYGKHSVRLRAGGRTDVESEENYLTYAQLLRPMYRAVKKRTARRV